MFEKPFKHITVWTTLLKQSGNEPKIHHISMVILLVIFFVVILVTVARLLCVQTSCLKYCLEAVMLLDRVSNDRRKHIPMWQKSNKRRQANNITIYFLEEELLLSNDNSSSHLASSFMQLWFQTTTAHYWCNNQWFPYVLFLGTRLALRYLDIHTYGY